MNLPSILKDLRNANKMSQSKVANAIEISLTHYQNYEYGKSEPTAAVIVKLCRYFDVSADYLLGLSDTGEIEPVTLGDGNSVVDCLKSADAAGTLLIENLSRIQNEFPDTGTKRIVEQTALLTKVVSDTISSLLDEFDE